MEKNFKKPLFLIATYVLDVLGSGRLTESTVIP